MTSRRPDDDFAAPFIAPKASAEGTCIFSKLVTMERVQRRGLVFERKLVTMERA